MARPRAKGERSAQQAGPLLHPKKSQGRHFSTGGQSRLHVKTGSVILHPSGHQGVTSYQADGYLLRSGMAGAVVDSLLEDAEEGRLPLRRQPILKALALQSNLRLRPQPCLGIEAQGGEETEVVQDRWAQVEDEVASPGQEGIGQPVSPLQGPPSLQVGLGPLRRLQGHQEGGEGLGRLVVQLPSYPLALLLLGSDGLDQELAADLLLALQLLTGAVQRFGHAV